MPLAISSFYGAADLGTIASTDLDSDHVGVAASVQYVGGAYIVTGGSFTNTLDSATSGDITDFPIGDFNFAGNVVQYQLDSATQGLLPSDTGVFGGQVIGWDAKDQIYLVDQYQGFTPTGGTPPATGTFTANGFTPQHFELVGVCNSGLPGVNETNCGLAGDTSLLDAYAANNSTFVFQVPEPASSSIFAAMLGIAFIIGRMRRGGARRA